jgi:hypothetical protein
MQYRPFWFSLFHPNLTGGLIAIIIFLTLMAIANLVSFANNIGSGEGLNFLVPTLMYGLPAYGLLRMKRWARMFELIYSILMVALGIFLLVAASVGMGAFIVVTHGVVAMYLLSEKCRRAFGLIPEEKS